MKEIDIEELDKLLTADFETGNLYWKESGTGRKDSGVAGSKTPDGYYQVCINNEVYRLHRVLWCLYYKSWPTEYIDHKDGDKENNSILNLRIASNRQNQYNSKLRNNFSGYRGVEVTSAKTFRARITLPNLSHKHLGTFNTAEEASIAYENEASLIHGEFYKDPGYKYDKNIPLVPLKVKENSIYKGVSKMGNKFQARISINGIRKSLGYFNSAEEASEAYQTALSEKLRLNS